MAPPFPSDYAHCTLGSLTVKDFRVQKRLSNISNLNSFLLPLLMGVKGEKKFIPLHLLMEKIDSDFDEVQPFRSVWS